MIRPRTQTENSDYMSNNANHQLLSVKDFVETKWSAL